MAGSSLSPDSRLAKNKQHKGGYMDLIADQEAKLISMNSLEEGEQFEADINNIMGIIDDVEKNMC